MHLFQAFRAPRRPWTVLSESLFYSHDPVIQKGTDATRIFWTDILDVGQFKNKILRHHPYG